MICKARLLIHAITGRFVDGHLCFESKLLREALYAFCDGLHECSDPNDTKSLDKFEKKLDQLINYLQRVREALANGEAVDDLSFCNEVTKRITSLIDILCNDISQSFSKREKEIRRHPGRSYRRPERADEANGFTDKDRATLDVIKTNIKKTHGEMRDANKRMDAILYCASNGKHGENPDLGGLITLVKHNMVEYGFNLICRDDTLSTAQAAKLTLEKYPPVMGAYKRDDPKDLEDLRQAIYRRCKEAGLLFKTNRKTMS